MLQFITHQADTEKMIDQAVKAIDGGALWIELRADGVTPADRTEAIRLAAERLIPLCRGKNIFLILNNQPDLVEELEVQGLHLEPDGMAPRDARLKLGGGPVIGVTVTSPREAVELMRRDIDYVRVNVTKPEEITPYAEAIKNAGGKLPIVAANDAITPDNAPDYLAAGAAGIALSAPIATAPDPLQATITYQSALQPH
ncbi:MAG: thiamine phosphate synthase [Candidatus Amulumruptor caecigallinarius]|nr:thiamine phosphate synthase [Candidatus Amulumruptor caecigallinarius]MCM1397768.1 thiamine phosphate synthase [Candidatus Amulumruptor caecigallinarius]